MQETTNIEQEFIDLAEKISRGAEVLPGGVMELARKFQEAKKENRPLRVKLGMDPTRPDLHLGHSVVMRKLREFQKAGHKVVLIIGGATAMIGDPSGKSETRPALTKEEVESNAKTYLEQVAKVIDISKAEVVNNAEWLHPLKLTELLQLASKITVAQMMTRDDFAKRYAEAKPIAIHEFFYPLLQAYDSVMIKSDIELGGTDQRFNVLMGRELQTAYGLPNQQMVMLLPLIEGTDGLVKMSKTYPEHCISLTENANDMYGKLMSIPDNLIIKYFSLLTDISNEELKNYEKELAQGANPRDLKMKLAYTITKMYNGEEVAQKAQENFVNVVQNKGIPEDIPEAAIGESKSILDFLVENNFSASKSEAKRLIAQGAVKIDNQKVTDVNYSLTANDKGKILQAGKRKFAKIV